MTLRVTRQGAEMGTVLSSSSGRRYGGPSVVLATCALLVLLPAAVALSAGPAGPPAAAGFSDEAVRKAIDKARNYLWSHQEVDGSWPGYAGYPGGPTGLVTYALLASGVSPLDKRLAKGLDWLCQVETNKTYSLALRCNACLLANKDTRGKYTRFLRNDMDLLVRATKDGGYGYHCQPDAAAPTADNSNSQYAVLGVWAGSLGLPDAPPQYWRTVMNHWRQCQNPDGGWSYDEPRRKSGSTPTMTAAGLATLFVCYDRLFADKFLRCDGGSEFAPIRAGLDWMDKHYVTALQGRARLTYFLYGVERVGLASGCKYFGKADWYRLGAERLIALQTPEGCWANDFGPVIETGFALLFLARGQHPVAFNKLQTDSDWNNRPRDLAGLTRWLTDSFERPLNWQTIDLDAPVEDWHDAAILYLAGAQDPQFTDDQLASLREFLWQGGAILSVTECQGQGFSQGIREVYQKVLPNHKLQPLPAGHELYSIQYALPDGKPEFFEISNGIRPLVLHTDADLSKSWQLQLPKGDRLAFEAAANVLAYVSDKGLLRNRGASHWPPKPDLPPGESIAAVRLKHQGDWDPEPLAMERFARLMGQREKLRVRLLAPTPIDRLAAVKARIALLTGTGALSLKAAEAAALKGFLQSGGTLIVDAAGGSPAFAKSAEAMLEGMFGPRCLRLLPASAALYHVGGREIDRVGYRRGAKLARGLADTPNLRGVELAGRLAVIFSAEDLTGGLVGCPSPTCVGYSPESCYDLMRNAFLLAYRTGRGPKAPASRPASTTAPKGQ
jgi:hypothetical protein